MLRFPTERLPLLEIANDDGSVDHVGVTGPDDASLKIVEAENCPLLFFGMKLGPDTDKDERTGDFDENS